MLQFELGRANVLGADLRQMLSDIDKAYLSSLRVAGTIVETFEGAGVQASQAQRVHVKMLEGLTRMIDGRGEMVGVVSRLVAMKSQSNISADDVGCPWPWDSAISATHAPETIEG